MLVLNLLPKEYKKELKLELLRRVLFAGVIFVVSAGLISGITLFSGAQYLNIQNNVFAELMMQVRGEEKAREVEKTEAAIVNLNKLMAQISSVQGESSHDLLAVVEKLANIIPQGVSLSTLTTSVDTGSVLIAGRAKLRSQVIALQDNLEKDAFFAQVDAPLSNLLSAEDVDFKFTLTLAP